MKVDTNISTEAEVENTREVRTAQSNIAAKAKKGHYREVQNSRYRIRRTC